MAITVMDGALVSNAHVSALDRGVLYGETAFELCRAYGSRVFELGLHLDRLGATCSALGAAIPDRDEVAADVQLALGEFGPADAAVRILVTRGNPEMAVACRRIVIASEPKLPPPRAYQRGIAAVVDRVLVVRANAPLSGHKWAGYAPPQFTALSRAEAHGAAEALLLDEEGAVVEGATSNVFAVRDGTLLTAASSGIRLGVIREVVIQIARERGLRVHFTPPVLEDADELFVTSSIREILPIAMVDGRTVGKGSFEAARTIHRELRARAGATGRMPWE